MPSLNCSGNNGWDDGSGFLIPPVIAARVPFVIPAKVAAFVIPAQAGIQGSLRKHWIPAYAGVTQFHPMLRSDHKVKEQGEDGP